MSEQTSKKLCSLFFLIRYESVRKKIEGENALFQCSYCIVGFLPLEHSFAYEPLLETCKAEQKRFPSTPARASRVELYNLKASRVQVAHVSIVSASETSSKTPLTLNPLPNLILRTLSSDLKLSSSP